MTDKEKILDKIRNSSSFSLNNPHCVIATVKRTTWDKFVSNPESTIPFDSMLVIGHSIEEAEKWLDTHEWEYLDTDVAIRPLIIHEVEVND